MRGVASAWLENFNCQGELEADIAVLELDEAHTVHFDSSVSICRTSFSSKMFQVFRKNLREMARWIDFFLR